MFLHIIRIWMHGEKKKEEAIAAMVIEIIE